MCIESNLFLDWLTDHFDGNQLRDLYTHGAVGGFPGITTYSQTGRLYSEFEDEIWQLLEAQADMSGHKSIMAFMSTLNGSDTVCNGMQFENLCVWFAAEEYARQLVEGGRHV